MAVETERVLAWPVRIPAGRVHLSGDLSLPHDAVGVAVFAHGSGSSRHSSRNKYVAEILRQGRIGTLLMDLLTAQEEQVDQYTAELRFDIGMLADRLVAATDYLLEQEQTRSLRQGYFGASMGGGAALVAAAARPDQVFAVVSRGGRPDLARDALTRVRAATLLIVGSLDTPVIQMNQDAMHRMNCVKNLEIVEGASHLFEEPGTLQQVAIRARDWFETHLHEQPG